MTDSKVRKKTDPRPPTPGPRMIKIGSRGSKLALCQARWVKQRIEERYTDCEAHIEVIKTTGDKTTDVPLGQIGVKGLFTKEIEEALLEGRIDLAVHSLKDMPTELPPGLILAALSERENPYDAFVARKDIRSFLALPQGATVGTSSLRRQCQIKNRRPDVKVVDLRGNVDTRLKKLESMELHAIILAAAGLIRLGLEDKIVEVLFPDMMVPAVGQGAMAVETREGDDRTNSLVSFLNHPPTETAVRAERAFLGRLGGGCAVPIAAYAEIEKDQLHIIGLVGSPDGRCVIKDKISGNAAQAEELGAQLAVRLIGRGAEEILSMPSPPTSGK